MSSQGPLQPGMVLNQRYEIQRTLRQEPFGDVMLGRDQLLDTEVSIKFLSADTPRFDAAFEYFRQEAVWGAKLHQPQILGVHYLEEIVEGVFLIQEPFSGTTLLHLIGKGEKLTIPDALYFVEVLAKGLAYAHKQGVVHQHFNPLNVLVSATEGVKIANFAFPPDDAAFPVPPEVQAYIPPEVLQSERPVPASNLYSLGILGYRMLTGTLPAAGLADTSIDLTDDLQKIPPALRPLLSQCLHPQVSQRTQNLAEFLIWLGRSREVLGAEAETVALGPEKESPPAPAPPPPRAAPPQPVITLAPEEPPEPEITITNDWLDEIEDERRRPGRLALWKDRALDSWHALRTHMPAVPLDRLPGGNKTRLGLALALAVLVLVMLFSVFGRKSPPRIDTVLPDKPMEEPAAKVAMQPPPGPEGSSAPGPAEVKAPEGPPGVAAGPASLPPGGSPLAAVPPSGLPTPAATTPGRPATPPAAGPAARLAVPKEAKTAKPPPKKAPVKKEQFSLLVATYAKETEARQLADKVRRQGKTATVRKSTRGKKATYQVWVASLPTREKADATAKSLAGSLGVTPKVVKVAAPAARQ